MPDCSGLHEIHVSAVDDAQVRYQLHVARHLHRKLRGDRREEFVEIARGALGVRRNRITNCQLQHGDVGGACRQGGADGRAEVWRKSYAQHGRIGLALARRSSSPDGLQSSAAPGLHGRDQCVDRVLNDGNVTGVEAVVVEHQAIDLAQDVILGDKQLLRVRHLALDQRDKLLLRFHRLLRIRHVLWEVERKLQQFTLMDLRSIGSKVCGVMEIEPSSQAAVEDCGKHHAQSPLRWRHGQGLK